MEVLGLENSDFLDTFAHNPLTFLGFVRQPDYAPGARLPAMARRARRIVTDLCGQNSQADRAFRTNPREIAVKEDEERSVWPAPGDVARPLPKLKRVRAIALLICGILVPFSTSTAQEPEGGTPTLSERAWIASKLYAITSQNFAHWEGVPQLDLDDWYQQYLGKAMKAKDRREFSLASMEFIAGLRNAHSNFFDEWLRREFGHPLGFSLERIDGRWIVTNSRLGDLDRGETVVSIDDETFDDFFERQKRYVSASSESSQVWQLFYMPYLFPESFKLLLESGIRHTVNRTTQKLEERSNQQSLQPRVLDEGIVYLPIRSFSRPEFEQDAIDFIGRHPNAKTLIIDVRGNGGGSSPVALVKSLMDRPWRGWVSASPYRLALGSAYAQIRKSAQAEQWTEYVRGGVDALSGMDTSMLMFPSALNQPDRPIYTEDILVLVDERCASACEDFVMPLRFSGRATVVGRPTTGSSGQPYVFDFGNGMSFRISTKRQYFPDGSTFEGVGIVPHIEVPITIDGVLSEGDEILDRAIEAALASRR